MHLYIVLLSDLSYQLGIIGIAEYKERLEIAHWLSMDGDDKPDPRNGPHKESENPRESDEFRAHDEAQQQQQQQQQGSGSGRSTEEKSNNRRLSFLGLKKWVFTVGDSDCYPSVPHGHFHRKTREWPKLNPYTGRVFSGMHKEDPFSRLTKDEMRFLWSDKDFLEHCRKQILWYSDYAKEYTFPNARFGRLQFPKW